MKGTLFTETAIKESFIYFPGGRVVLEVSKGVLEPIVDLVQRQLLVLGVHDGLKVRVVGENIFFPLGSGTYLSDERCIREWRSNVVHLVKVLILENF